MPNSHTFSLMFDILDNKSKKKARRIAIVATRIRATARMFVFLVASSNILLVLNTTTKSLFM